MTVPATNPEDVKQDTSADNLVKQRKYYERQLEQERQGRMQAEEKAAQLEKDRQSKRNHDEDDEDDEPYIDKRKFKKELSKFEQGFDERIERKATEKAQSLFEAKRKEEFFEQNTDYDQVMSEQVLEKFVKEHPGLAKTLMNIPKGFERDKLVYENIKALNAHRVKESSIQKQIDDNKKFPGYQPSGMAASPYSKTIDFSEEGRKAAYDKLQANKKRVRF